MYSFYNITVEYPNHFLCVLQVFSTYVPTECVSAGEELAHARGRQAACLQKKTHDTFNLDRRQAESIKAV